MNTTLAASDDSSGGDNTYALIGIFANLAINIILALERIVSKTKKSECTAGANGVSVKVDNSKDEP